MADAAHTITDLRAEMEEAKPDPVANAATAATDTALAAKNSIHQYADDLADLVRRQPLASLGIGMGVAYLLGRIVTRSR